MPSVIMVTARTVRATNAEGGASGRLLGARDAGRRVPVVSAGERARPSGGPRGKGAQALALTAGLLTAVHPAVSRGGAAVTPQEAPAPSSSEEPPAPSPSDQQPPAPATAPPAALEVLFHADLDGRLATPGCVHSAKTTTPPGYAELLGRLAALREAADRENRPAPLALLGGNLATPDLAGAALLERGPAGIDALGAILAAPSSWRSW